MPRQLTLCLLALGALSASAASGAGLEIYPFAAYTAALGGSFDGDDGFPDTELDDDASFGLGLDIPVGPGNQLELWFSRQDTTLQLDSFGNPGVTDVEIDHFHIGIVSYRVYQKVEPFGFFSGGLTQINPEGPFDSETRPSLATGGGVRVFLGRGARVGFRFTGRLIGTYFEGDRRIFCGPADCLGNVSDSFLLQGQVEAGLTIRLR